MHQLLRTSSSPGTLQVFWYQMGTGEVPGHKDRAATGLLASQLWNTVVTIRPVGVLFVFVFFILFLLKPYYIP